MNILLANLSEVTMAITFFGMGLMIGRFSKRFI